MWHLPGGKGEGAVPGEVGEVSRGRQGLNPMALWSVRPLILFPVAGQDLIDNFKQSVGCHNHTSPCRQNRRHGCVCVKCYSGFVGTSVCRGVLGSV